MCVKKIKHSVHMINDRIVSIEQPYIRPKSEGKRNLRLSLEQNLI